MINRNDVINLEKATNEERYKYHCELIKFYGAKAVPIRDVFDKEWYPRVKIYRDDEIYAQFYYDKKDNLTLLGDPIIYVKDINRRKQIMTQLIEMCTNIRISDISKYLCGNAKLEKDDGNYYCYIPKTLSKYNNKKWLKTRKVYLDDNRIRLVPYNKKEHYDICLKLHNGWKQYLSNKMPLGFERFYKRLLQEKNYMDTYNYKGLVLTYRNVPVMFRFYREIDECKGIMVDFENSISSFIDNKVWNSEYLVAVIPIILENRKIELTENLIKINKRLEELNKDRAIYRDKKDWKTVKKIVKESEELEKEKNELITDWKIKEYNEFNKFIKNSCVNYNRKEFLEYVSKQGYLWYYEDGGFGTLLEYKSEKNDYVNNFYMG